MTRLRQLRLLALACAVGTAACAPSDPGAGLPAVDERANDAAALLASVQASPFGTDSVRFILQVTNTTAAPVELTYPTGQSFDFVVSRGGREVWRWSGDRMFTQAFRSETLGPGETRTHTATWTPPADARGEYSVLGTLTARNASASQSATFRIE